MTDANAVALADECSIWRNNDVRVKLRQGKTWATRPIPITELDVQQAESRHGQIWARNRYSLVALVADEELRQLEPYSRYGAGQEVAFPIVLALLRDGRYRIFDGVHRAYQLVLNGKAEIEVCAPTD